MRKLLVDDLGRLIGVTSTTRKLGENVEYGEKGEGCWFVLGIAKLVSITKLKRYTDTTPPELRYYYS